MRIAVFLMRKLQKILTEIWKLSTNVRKTNHILSRFLEEWRNVVAWMLYGPRSIWYRYYTFCYGQYESQKKDILKNIHSSCKKINFFHNFRETQKMCTLLQLLVSIYMQHRNICRKDCEWTKYIFHFKEKILSWKWKDFSSHLEMIMNKLQVFWLNTEVLEIYCMQISKFKGKNKPKD